MVTTHKYFRAPGTQPPKTFLKAKRYRNYRIITRVYNTELIIIVTNMTILAAR